MDNDGRRGGRQVLCQCLGLRFDCAALSVLIFQQVLGASELSGADRGGDIGEADGGANHNGARGVRYRTSDLAFVSGLGGRWSDGSIPRKSSETAQNRWKQPFGAGEFARSISILPDAGVRPGLRRNVSV